MRIEQTQWSAKRGWWPHVPGTKALRPQLVFVFGSRHALDADGSLSPVRKAFPEAYITGCSTAGEIFADSVFDETLVVTALELGRSTIEHASIELATAGDSAEAGASLAAQLPHPTDLRHVIVLSEGLHVNGSDLVQGLSRGLPPHVTVTGGLSGDGSRFEKTRVIAEGIPRDRAIVAVGFYGPSLRVGYGSLGGWDPFGPERLVTRSQGNVLFELDGQSALALYKKYLGDQADELPASGLLFPLAIRDKNSHSSVVRTILAVDETGDSMTFAGDIPPGCYARLMKANFDRLVDGAVGAARISYDAVGGSPEVALLISCVGRKMVLKQRIEEEVEGVREIVGPETVLAGFYSYGEISPFTPNARCELHNQTMTVTTLSEQ